MGAKIEAELAGLSKEIGATEARLEKIREALEQTSIAAARHVMLETMRALHRLAQAARLVQLACPQCGRPSPKMNYEAVNTLSGVWHRQACPTCNELHQVVAALEKFAPPVSDERG